MNHNRLQKNTILTMNRWVWLLLATIIGLLIGQLYLYHNGILEVSSMVLVTSLISGILGVSIAVGIIYFVKRKLKLRGVCPEEIGDERAQLIRYKAALKTIQCVSISFGLSPVFLFIDYKLSIYWMQIASIILINAIYFSFMFYYSHKLD